MKSKGALTMLINSESTTIEIHDRSSNTIFCEIQLTPQQLSALLSRQAYVDCEMEINNLDRVGKTHEWKTHEFEIPKELVGNDKELQKLVQSTLTDGWISDGYFGSQNSLFKKDGKQFVRVTIRRYI